LFTTPPDPLSVKVTRPSKLIAEAGVVKDTKAIFSVSPSIPENRE
jgi:hypothetical protein